MALGNAFDFGKGLAAFFDALSMAADLVRQSQAAPIEEVSPGGAASEALMTPRDRGTRAYEHRPSDEDPHRVERTFEDGRRQVENLFSGVILEERPDASMILSLPGGQVLFQGAPGEPVLVFNPEGSPPALAQVNLIRAQAGEEPVMGIHFRDAGGIHLVELESLRYFRMKG